MKTKHSTSYAEWNSQKKKKGQRLNSTRHGRRIFFEMVSNDKGCKSMTKQGRRQQGETRGAGITVLN